MRVLGYGFTLVLVILIAAPVILCVLALENTPSVEGNRTIGSRDYDRAEKLVRRAQFALADPGLSTTISANQFDLDSLATFLARSLEGLTGDVRVLPDGTGVRVAASYRTPPNPIGRYVNLGVTVRPSRTGLDVAALDLGRIHLGPKLARPVINLVASLVLGPKLGTDVLDSVKGLTIADQWVTLTIRPDATIEDRFKERVTDVAVAARPPAVAAYYRRIMQIAADQDPFRQVAFVTYVQPLLAMAEERSKQSDPVTEMHGVVFALALYFGGDRLDRLREALLPRDLAATRPPEAENVVVRGRHDHVQHFIVSAAFTLSGGVGFTTTIGEAKEFDDLMRGGSDFSFQDIAADRTGITFARLAETPGGARFLESLGDQPLSESLFFPVVSDLPDGMPPAQFDATYHDIESPAFKAMLADIDRRIEACGAYRP
jgi:hypothetical protein